VTGATPRQSRGRSKRLLGSLTRPQLFEPPGGGDQRHRLSWFLMYFLTLFRFARVASSHNRAPKSDWNCSEIRLVRDRDVIVEQMLVVFGTDVFDHLFLSHRQRRSHRGLVPLLSCVSDRDQAASSVKTLKLARLHGPNEVTIATSVASRPRAIKIRPIRG
jgi:hypothetical protein